MKKLFLVSTAIIGLTVGHAQTNVSGGIYSNTTWLKANSPYIVTDTVVVFPNVTLTIQPGVTIKFANNKRLEIRQAKLIAIGTATDSITFTSNSPTPSLGIWSGIYLNPNTSNHTHKFSYCNFKYAHNAIDKEYNDSLIIKHSSFKDNYTGIGNDYVYGIDNVFIDTSSFINNVCGIGSYVNNPAGTRLVGGKIDSCNFSSNQNTGILTQSTDVKNSIFYSNQIGVFSQGGGTTITNCIISYNTMAGIESDVGTNTIQNCQIKYNDIGIKDYSYQSGNLYTQNIIDNNNIGIRIEGNTYNPARNIYCNRICANTTYDFYNNATWAISIPQNYWCTSDSTSTTAVIYDGYDNINLGLVSFMPLDTICSPNILTNINENNSIKNTINIFPNPFSAQTTLETAIPLTNATLTVDNYFGQTVAQIKHISGQTVTFSRDNLASGLYFVRLTEENKTIAVDKLVITDR